MLVVLQVSSSIYLKKNIRILNSTGVDIRKDLLKSKKTSFRKSFSKKIDINKKLQNSDKKLIDNLFGVIGIFDNLDNFSKNLKNLLSKKGMIFIELL